MNLPAEPANTRRTENRVQSALFILKQINLLIVVNLVHLNKMKTALIITLVLTSLIGLGVYKYSMS